MAQGDRGLGIPDLVITMLPTGIGPDERRGSSREKQNPAGGFHLRKAGKRAGKDVDRRPCTGSLLDGQ